MISRINPQWSNNLDNAITTIEKLLSLFTVGSEGYNRIEVFLKTLKIAKGLDYKPEDEDNKYYLLFSFCIWYYYT